MATLPTARDTALLILEVLVHDLKMRPGDAGPDNVPNARFPNHGGDVRHIPAGLKYAAEQDWLIYEACGDKFLLTGEGFAAA